MSRDEYETDAPESQAGPESPPEVHPRPLEAAVEAVLMVSPEPVPAGLLAELLEISLDRVEALCAQMAATYGAERRGFTLVRLAGGYRFQSHPDFAAHVERFVLDGSPTKLSSAALETLAVVAYKQPVSRAQISAIRGVNADGVLRLLTTRGYVAEVGRDSGPGQAVLFGTTETFLEKLGMDSLKDLPSLAEFVPPASTVEMLERVLRPDETGPD
ncbi:MAG TPA: SMC-Scp complex subunit ScpB [Acidimicrobiales bacterium]|nr:SMC-Scp complex subunit ScpB [Acidimicrobiales bacterium]